MNDHLVIGGFIAVIVAMIVGIVAYGIQEQQDWDRFAAVHECKVVEHIRGTVSTGLGFVGGKTGMVTTSTPSRVVYMCNDGVRYTR